MKRTANLIIQHLFWRGLYFFSVLLLNILIARSFAAEKSGQIFFITNNLAFLMLLVSMSLESGAVYYISSGKADAVQMGRFFLLWTLIAGFVATAGWWFSFKFTASPFFGKSKIIGAGILFITGVLLTTFFNALFYSKQQFGLPNKILSGVNAALIMVLIFGSQWPWVGENFLLIYFSCFFFQGVLVMIIFFIWYPEKRIKGMPSSSILKKVFRYSVIALIANAVYFLVNRMDYWFVEHYCSARDLGNYIQASKLGQMMLIIPSILSSTLFPLIASGKRKNSDAGIVFIARVLLWINISISAAITTLGYWAFPILFGASFIEMYSIFLLIIPGLLCLTVNYPLTALNSGKDLIKRNIQGSLLALLVIGSGDFFILPHAGVRSAAAISSIGYLSYYCYILYLYRKDHASRLTDFFLIKKADIFWLLSRICRIIGERKKNPLKAS